LKLFLSEGKRWRHAGIPLVILVLLVLSSSTRLASPAAATSPSAQPNLGTAAGFGVLAAGAVSNTGASNVAGNLGVDPSATVVGFPPGVVTGTIHKDDSAALQAKDDVASAYSALAGDSCTENLTRHNLGGLTLTPGVYCYSSAASLSGTLTLNTEGDTNGLYVFQIEGSLTTSGGSSVTTTSGSGCDVFWQVGGAAVLGAQTAFAGSILSVGSITMGTGTNTTGSAMTQDGSVSMNANHVASQCAISIWKQQVSSFQQNVGQCGEVKYPSTIWEKTQCSITPDLQPDTVGGMSNNDMNGTQASGYLFGSAQGEVTSMTGFSSESDSLWTGGIGPTNVYSEQVDSNHYRNSSFYGGTTMTSSQHYWQQFIFINEPATGGAGIGIVELQYWLLNYLANHASCPTVSSGWSYFPQWYQSGTANCYTSTYYTSVPESDPSGLAGYSLEGCVNICNGAGTDSAIFCYGGTCDYNNAPDTILGLGSYWTGVEWNVLGRSGGSTADFVGTGSHGTDITGKVLLRDSSGIQRIPSLATSTKSVTAESNNLNLYQWSDGTGYYTFTECQITPC
jgi:hypothetical protein